MLTKTLAWVFVAVGLLAGLAFDQWAIRTLPRPKRRPPASRATWAAWLVVLAGIAAYALLWVPAYHRPDYTWDGMAYHLPTVHFWAAKGYVHWIQPVADAGDAWKSGVDALLNAYPKTGEVVAFLLARLSDGKLVNGLNLAFLPLGIFGIAAIAEELGASRPAAFAAGMLFVVVPTNVGQAASTYVDTAFASAVIAFFAFLFVQLRMLARSPDLRLRPPLLVASGAALGLALGIKAPALGLTALAFVAVGVVLAVRLRRRPKRRRRHVLAAALGLTLMGAIAVPIGGFWYVRNVAVVKNPIHPFEVKLGGRVLLPGESMESFLSEPLNTPAFMHGWSNVRKIFFTWRQSGRVEWPIDAVIEHNPQGYALDVAESHDPSWPRCLRYNDPRSGGLGFSWLLGGVPSLVALCALYRWRARRGSKTERLRARRDLLVVGAMIVLCLLFQRMFPMNWWARYTLWFHGIGLPALAFVMHATLEGLPRRRPFAFVTAPLLLGLVLVSFFEYAYALKWDHTPAYFVGPARVNHKSSPSEIWHALTTTKDQGVAAIYVDLSENELAREALSGNGIIAVAPVSVGNTPVIGHLSMPVGARNWIMMPPEIGTDQDAATKYVMTYLPKWILWDIERNGEAPVFERTATRTGWLRSMRIYELGEQSSPSTTQLKPK